ncbi:sulfatase family protein [Arthrobacter castelli]|uniref:sulfatase family protein n=1 Tax=Arthrobacter castelli TaxID=271431 RepID=UPI0003FE3B48|nr:sulfatase-like hydrolase/transferase [Arthrobacter castelli]
MTAPNFLVLFCDQLRADALGAYGNPVVKTPNIDRLAANSAIYSSAYTPSPVCVPARASFVTGNEPQTNHCFANGDPMPDSATFMDELSGAGYRTHGVGKMHFTPDAQAKRGFQSRDRGEEFLDPGGDDYLEFVARNGYGYVEYPHGLRDEMYYVPQLSPVPEELHYSRWVADRSIDFLSAADQDTPFLLWSSFIAPHPPFAPPSPWHRMYEPSLMPDPHDPPGAPGLMTAYNRLQNRYKFRDGGQDRRLWQLLRAYYYASISYVDFQIGRILEALETTGRRQDTVVILTADHGEMLGDYASFGKRSFLDAAARIPLICNGPGFESTEVTNPVSLIDIRPTIAQLAGLPAPDVDGSSLLSIDPPRTVFGQYQREDLGLYATITNEWKYIWSAPDQREFLIDRQRDPAETRNLAYNVRTGTALDGCRQLATDHFHDLHELDFAAASSNVRLPLDAPPSRDSHLAIRALDIDDDASTLVVQADRNEKN